MLCISAHLQDGNPAGYFPDLCIVGIIVAGCFLLIVSRYEFMGISQPIFDKRHYLLAILFFLRLMENVTKQTFIWFPYFKIYNLAFFFLPELFMIYNCSNKFPVYIIENVQHTKGVY